MDDSQGREECPEAPGVRRGRVYDVCGTTQPVRPRACLRSRRTAVLFRTAVRVGGHREASIIWVPDSATAPAKRLGLALRSTSSCIHVFLALFFLGPFCHPVSSFHLGKACARRSNASFRSGKPLPL